jgi:hypothetical protein
LTLSASQVTFTVVVAAGPVPALLCAVTVTVYVPAASFDTEAVRTDLPSFSVCPPGDSVKV